MSNSYLEMKARHQKEFDEFPLKFAFSNEQFNRVMEELGLKPEQTDMVVRIEGGGFMLKSDAPRFAEMVKRIQREEDEAIENDKTGDGYLYEMFLYELENHEFSYTGDVEETLEALGYTAEEVVNDERLNHALTKAVGKIKCCNWW